jgi:hypothetical protein
MRRLGLLSLLLCALCVASTARADEWLDRTLQFQQRLGDKLPLRNAPWLGTHNSFNTRAEVPTLSGLDANQTLSMAEQLDAGMRSLEIDIHTFPSLLAPGTPAPVVCHARSQEELNAGCTSERLLDARLQEIRTWLDAHPREVVLIYFEDHFGGVPGADEAARMLDEVLGAELYKPPAGGCAAMPLDLTRAKMRRKGKQVLAISGCTEGSTWSGLTWDDAERAGNEIGAEDFQDYPNCDPDPGRDFAHYALHFVRAFEDSTVLSAVTGIEDPPARITPDRTRALIHCGVDLLGFDQLEPDDPRLAAAVWSWAPGEPSKPGCVVQRAKDARWESAPCAGHGRFACRTRGGSMTVGGLERYRRAKRACAGARFGIPRTGFDSAQLREAMRLAKVDRVWLRYKVK